MMLKFNVFDNKHYHFSTYYSIIFKSATIICFLKSENNLVLFKMHQKTMQFLCGGIK